MSMIQTNILRRAYKCELKKAAEEQVREAEKKAVKAEQRAKMAEEWLKKAGE
jgi:hypothetical protein